MVVKVFECIGIGMRPQVVYKVTLLPLRALTSSFLKDPLLVELTECNSRFSSIAVKISSFGETLKMTFGNGFNDKMFQTDTKTLLPKPLR